MIKKRKTFKQAILETPQVKDYYCEGKKAIPNVDRSKIELTDAKKCGGSLFIDESLLEQGLYPNDARWEVHTASSHEVRKVINKLNWLKDWLNTRAPEINKLKATTKAAYYWIQSNGNHIKGASYLRAAAQNGISPISKLILK